MCCSVFVHLHSQIDEVVAYHRFTAYSHSMLILNHQFISKYQNPTCKKRKTYKEFKRFNWWEICGQDGFDRRTPFMTDVNFSDLMCVNTENRKTTWKQPDTGHSLDNECLEPQTDALPHQTESLHIHIDPRNGRFACTIFFPSFVSMSHCTEVK